MPLAACTGECQGFVLGGLVIIGLLAIIALTMIGRRLVVNARRRARGLAPLRWREIGDLDEVGARHLDGVSAADVQQAEALRRQIAWEHHEAMSEMSRYGRAQSRRYCKKHQRWCRHPEYGPHPPGGLENTSPPPDWLLPR